MATETISVRLDARTKQILAESAATHDAAGASALARDILERLASETLATRRRASFESAAAFLVENDGDWADDPAEFFPDIARF
jgi:hypothetical protein